MKSNTWYYRPSRLGLRTAEAARLAKRLNDAADDGRLVACLTIDGQLAVDAELVRELQAQGKCGHREQHSNMAQTPGVYATSAPERSALADGIR